MVKRFYCCINLCVGKVPHLFTPDIPFPKGGLKQIIMIKFQAASKNSWQKYSKD